MRRLILTMFIVLAAAQNLYAAVVRIYPHFCTYNTQLPATVVANSKSDAVVQYFRLAWVVKHLGTGIYHRQELIECNISAPEFQRV